MGTEPMKATEQATHTFRGVKVVIRGSWPSGDQHVACIATPGSESECAVPFPQLRKIQQPR